MGSKYSYEKMVCDNCGRTNNDNVVFKNMRIRDDDWNRLEKIAFVKTSTSSIKNMDREWHAQDWKNAESSSNRFYNVRLCEICKMYLEGV